MQNPVFQLGGNSFTGSFAEKALWWRFHPEWVGRPG
jgi:hypothetical protein